MSDTSEDIDKFSSASILEDTVKKINFWTNTLDNESIEVLMDPSSYSVVTYVKPGLIEKKVFRYKNKVGNLGKEIYKVVVNEKLKVIFAEKR